MMNYPEFVSRGELATTQIQDAVWDIVGHYPQGGKDAIESYELVTFECLEKFHQAYREYRGDWLKPYNTPYRKCVAYARDYIAVMGYNGRWERAAKMFCIGKQYFNTEQQHAFILVYSVMDNLYPVLTYCDSREAGIRPLQEQDFIHLEYFAKRAKTGISALVFM